MLIAIDYDDTYTADPELWKLMLLHAKARGHTVICVTARSGLDGDEVDAALGRICDRIIFTAGDPKKEFLKEVRECSPDVWIDDCPESICGCPEDAE